VVGCTIGSREVPGERKPVIRYDDKVKAKVKLSLCFFLTKHHAKKAYWGREV